MTFKDWYIEQFRETLDETLQIYDGMSDTEINESLCGRSIPAAMRAYYRVAGNHWLNTNHNHMRAPSGLETIGEYTIFMDENQVVAQWGILTSEIVYDDPVVHQGHLSGSEYEWHVEHFTFSRFMVAMWRWVITGEVPAQTSPRIE